MKPRAQVREAAAIVATALAMTAAALWNGYPLLFFDSYAYLGSADYSTLYRAPAYFWLAYFGRLGGSAWLVVAMQNVMLAYALLRSAQVIGAWPARRAATLAVMIGTAFALGATWTQSQLMADALTPTFVLALAVVVVAERANVVDRVLLVLAALGHYSHLATLAVVSIAWLLLAETSFAPRASRLRLAAFLTIALGAVVPRAFSTKASGQGISWQPFALGSLLEAGALVPMLEARCPHEPLVFCPWLDRLRATPDAGYLLWVDSGPVRSTHGKRNHPDYVRMVELALRDEPLTALSGGLRRAIVLSTRTTAADRVELVGRETHTHERMREYAASEYLDFVAARQQTFGSDSLVLPRLAHRVAAAMALGALAAALWRRKQRLTRVAHDALLVAVWCFFANALVCATLSSVRDRYQARLYWVPLAIAAFVVLKREESVVMGSNASPALHARA